MSKQRDAREVRHRERQDQIIAAARRCFSRAGFHGASMSQLAAESQLSVGQIYRYFRSKDAIVEEMVRRIVARRVALIEGKTAAERLPTLLAERHPADRDDELLMLEVAAEASRNPQVAAILQAADDEIYHNAMRELRASYPHWDNARLAACVEVIAVLINGTAYRRLTPQNASAAQLYPIYQQLFKQLFETEDK